ncbi:MAG: PH domain-containing protein [Candidatus Gracilibacteria bacterium]|jgi:hypothetical protein
MSETNTAETTMIQSHTTRKTGVILMTKIIISIILFDILYAGIILLGDIIGTKSSYNLGIVKDYNALIMLLFASLQIFIIIFIFLRWNNQYYSVKGEFVSKFSGIVLKKQYKLNILNIDEISYEQYIFGKLLNYGTITIIYGKDQKLVINDIPYPEEFIKHIEYNKTINKK